MTESINLGACSLLRIRYNDVREGDIVCTYEPLSTNRKIRKLANFQNIICLFQRPHLSRTFHFQIITKTLAKIGCYEIAHVDGSKGEVLLQEDDFLSHYSGQAFLIFRAKNLAYRNEILEVARQTAKEGNSHRARRLPFTPFKILQKGCEIFRWFLFENFPTFFFRGQHQKVAQLCVDFGNEGRFLHPNNRQPLDMGCPEYVGNVLSVAKVRLLAKSILNDPSLSRQQKIRDISNMLKRVSFPFDIANPYVSSSFLVDRLLNFKEDFSTPGYLGFINQQMLSGDLQTSTKKKRLSLKQLLAILPAQICFQQLHPDLLIRVLQSFGILSDKGEFITTSCRLDFQGKCLFAALYCLAKKTKLKIITSREQAQFLARFKALHLAQEEEKLPSLSNDRYDLSIGLKRDLLSLERKLIYEEIAERKDRTHYLAMNSIRQMYLEIPWYQKILFFIFPQPVYNYVRNRRIKEISKLERCIECVYARSQTN